ncbi:hypothetical protein M422DRAFT_177109 [Sphaerobolus stellatus SS14]|uniref:CxC2-like cysteine cluster KDZ transposase-associated domain-containing protein n=1 Tax=Sphaerobolus stellatus (strain SS14) TaxID=990650 RepID=A0A0C9UTD0_SPHS4|nr:hypothetical protein M422DRAFT_177109 [Sphaerobolus stellatus SS14]
MYQHEAPPVSKLTCFGDDCTKPGVYNCVDCDDIGFYCQNCILVKHQHLPFHWIEEWDGNSEQLFTRKWFPATILCPRTAFTFRVLKLFHLLNHMACTTPWDFAGTMHRITDHVCTTDVTDIYKTFKHVQRQWRVVCAWKRGGVRDAKAPRQPGSLVIGCVSCPMPGINLNANWEKHPDS